MKKILIISFIILTATLPVYAQSGGGSNTSNPTNNRLPTYTLLEPLPCIPNATPAADDPCTKAGEIQTKLNFKYYVQYMFNLLIAVAAVASVFMIVYGGFQYMSTDSWQGKSDGLSKVKNALLGLLLVLTSYIILRTIDPRLVAIPTTLVPPLNIQYESVGSGLLGQLQKEVDSFSTSNLAAKAKVAEALKKNEERQARIAELKEQREELVGTFGMGADESDPEVQSIDAKIAAYQNEMIRETASAYLMTDKVVLDAEIYKFGPSSGTKTLNWAGAAQQIETVYIKRYTTLKQAGAEPDQLQELTRYKDYAKLAVEINHIVAKVVQEKLDYDNSITPIQTDSNANARIAVLRTDANSAIADIARLRIFTNPDPVIKSLLLKHVSEAQDFLETIKIE